MGATGTFAAFLILSLFSAPLHHPAAAVILLLFAGQVFSKGQRTPPKWRSTLNLCLALPVLVFILGASLWLGGRGLVSKLWAANAVVCDLSGQEKYERLTFACDLDPGNIDLGNALGQIAAKLALEAKGDTAKRFREDALSRLRSVFLAHPYHPGALKTLARLNAAEGDIEEVRHMIQFLLDTQVEEGEPEDLLLQFLEEAGRYNKAAEVLVESFPNGLALALERAQTYLEKGNHQAAVLFADRYLSRKPLDGDALYVLGRCLKELYGEGEIDVYRRMHLAYALEWIEAGDWRQARRSVRSSLRYGQYLQVEPLLSAIIKNGEGQGFTPPNERIQSAVFLDRLQDLAAEGKLPREAAAYIEDL
jgi:hypothetical protein